MSALHGYSRYRLRPLEHARTLRERLKFCFALDDPDPAPEVAQRNARRSFAAAVEATRERLDVTRESWATLKDRARFAGVLTDELAQVFQDLQSHGVHAVPGVVLLSRIHERLHADEWRAFADWLECSGGKGDAK